MRDRYHRGGLGHAWAMVRQPEPRDSRSMDTVVWADRMFVNIASYVFAFIVFFAVSCLLLLGGVASCRNPTGIPRNSHRIAWELHCCRIGHRLAAIHSLRVVPSAEPNRERNANWLQVSRERSHTLTVFATHCAVSVNLNVLSPEPLALTL